MNYNVVWKPLPGSQSLSLSCNSGIPHEPDTHWDSGSKSWEFNGVRVNTDLAPNSLSSEVKEALKNNICIVCGEKNCPYIKDNKNYKELIDSINRGDKAEANKIYTKHYAQFRNTKKSTLEDRNNKAKTARARQGACGYSGPFQSKKALATPGQWSEWTELFTSFPNEITKTSDTYTVNFNLSSNLESSFDVEIKYPTSSGVKVVNTMGLGAYLIEATGGGGFFY
ncbi:colicin Z family toxin [Providencia sp.]|uniref:colicin Z family toxin n=1 Tax=Providencia sp. TaxID=589 RepID=UPI003F9BAC9A